MLRTMCGSILVVLLSVTVVAAQPVNRDGQGAKRSASGQRVTNAGARLANEFSKKGPKIGDLLPDVTVYDADGKEFKLRRVKGHYAVIVSGCLT